MGHKYQRIANNLVGAIKADVDYIALSIKRNTFSYKDALMAIEHTKAILWYRLLPKIYVPKLFTKQDFLEWYDGLPPYVKRLNTDLVWNVIRDNESVAITDLEDEFIDNGGDARASEDAHAIMDELMKIPTSIDLGECSGLLTQEEMAHLSKEIDGALLQFRNKCQTIALMYQNHVKEDGGDVEVPYEIESLFIGRDGETAAKIATDFLKYSKEYKGTTSKIIGRYKQLVSQGKAKAKKTVGSGFLTTLHHWLDENGAIECKYDNFKTLFR